MVKKRIKSRLCDHCEVIANTADINCRKCGSVLPPISYEPDPYSLEVETENSFDLSRRKIVLIIGLAALMIFVICSMLAGGDEKQSASETTNTPIEKASQFATQINAIATMTNCLVLNTHYEYALDSRWKAATEFEKRDADAYMDAVGKRLRAVCD